MEEDYNFDHLNENEEEDDINLPESKPEVQVSPEERAEMDKIKNKLVNYRDGFPKHLELYSHKLDTNILNTLRLDELKRTLEDVRKMVSSRNDAMHIKSIYLGAMGIVENFGPRFNVNLTGLQMAIMKNEYLDDIFKEINIEYGNNTYVDPCKKLVFSTIQMMMGIKYQNDLIAEQTKFNKQKVSSEIENDFSDI